MDGANVVTTGHLIAAEDGLRLETSGHNSPDLLLTVKSLAGGLNICSKHPSDQLDQPHVNGDRTHLYIRCGQALDAFAGAERSGQDEMR